jgi:hypothetical protein
MNLPKNIGLFTAGFFIVTLLFNNAIYHGLNCNNSDMTRMIEGRIKFVAALAAGADTDVDLGKPKRMRWINSRMIECKCNISIKAKFSNGKKRTGKGTIFYTIRASSDGEKQLLFDDDSTTSFKWND